MVGFAQLLTEVLADVCVVFHNQDAFFVLSVFSCRLFRGCLVFRTFFVFRIDDIHVPVVGGVDSLFLDGFGLNQFLFRKVCRLLGGQIDGESASDAFFALQFDTPMMQLHEALYQ